MDASLLLPPNGQVSTSWFRLDESPLHARQPISYWRVLTSRRGQPLHLLFLKRLLANKLLHLLMSLLTLGNLDPCQNMGDPYQRQTEGSTVPCASFGPTNWRAG